MSNWYDPNGSSVTLAERKLPVSKGVLAGKFTADTPLAQ